MIYGYGLSAVEKKNRLLTLELDEVQNGEICGRFSGGYKLSANFNYVFIVLSNNKKSF